MNDTRKQIIELIEPYMDKTLNEGCLIKVLDEIYAGPGNGCDCFDSTYYIGKVISIKREKWFDYDYEKDDIHRKEAKQKLRKIERNKYGNGYIRYSKDYIYDFGMDGKTYWREVGEGEGSTDETEEILGHYDITAVLKYIRSCDVRNYIFLDTDNFFAVGLKEGNELNEALGIIQNKPLHLYTEQEDKELLELLLKLK